MHVAGNQLNGLLGYTGTEAHGSGTVADVSAHLSNQLGCSSVGSKEEAQGTAQADASGIAALQTLIEQARADQW